MRFELNILIECSVILTCVLARDVQKTRDLYLPDYNIYHNLSSILVTVIKLQRDNPDILNISFTYKSRQGIDIPVLHLHQPLSNHPTHNSTKKQTVLLVYGIHSREFFPVESAIQFLRNMTSLHKSTVPESTAYNLSQFILKHFNVYLIPLLNPDGRQYIERTGNMCWRGTSTGVDLERNFEWGFGGAGSSSNKLDEEYRGGKAFSEPEAHAIQLLAEKIGHIDCFISFHSGIKHIYVPFADTASREKKILPPYFRNNLLLAKELSNSVILKFAYGPVFKLNSYSMDGTMFDYMAAVRKSPYSLTVEMWGDGDSHSKGCFDLFNPKSTDLSQCLHQVSPMYSTLFHYLHSHPIISATAAAATLGGGGGGEVVASSGASLYLYFLVIGLLLLLSAWNRKHLPSVKGLFAGRRIVNLRNIGNSFYTNQSSFKKV